MVRSTLARAPFCAPRLFLLAVLLLASPPISAQFSGSDRALERSRMMAEVAKRQLDRVGVEVDLDTVGIELVDPETMRDDLVRQNHQMFRDGHFDRIAAFLWALGLVILPEAELVISDFVQSSQQTLGAYYQADRDAFVFIQAFNPAIGELVLHELVHAGQDQRGEFDRLFSGDRRTFDRSLAALTLLEGEAECVVLTAYYGEDNLRALREEELDPYRGLNFDHPTSQLYLDGRRFMARRFKEAGWEGMREALANPPPSTEQVLHPSKYRLDEATEVSGARLPLPVLGEDTIGESRIRHFIRLLGATPAESFIAAAGWDGDRVVIHEGAEGRPIVTWTSVWDRIEDAEQFAAALREHGPGRVAQRGRAVCWHNAKGGFVARILRGTLLDPGEPNAEDARTTAEIEAAWREKNPEPAED